MIIGSGNNIQAAYITDIAYTKSDGNTGSVLDSNTTTPTTGPILVEGTQALGNLWRVSTTGTGTSLKADPNQLYYADSNSIIGARNIIEYNTDRNFLAGSDNKAYADSHSNFLAGSHNIAGLDLLQSNGDYKSLLKELGISLPSGYTRKTLPAEVAINQILNYSAGLTGTAGNLLAGAYNVAGKGSLGNIVQGNNVVIRNNVVNSYVLGSRVDVTQSNSVYIGNSSVATVLPTTISDVDTNGKTKTSGTTFGADTQFGTLSLNELNTLITAGEKGQQNITINGKTYNFAGQGKTGGGVISVGGIKVEGNATSGYKNVSYGRIIQNVAPGLVGANSTDAINGSQLFCHL